MGRYSRVFLFASVLVAGLSLNEIPCMADDPADSKIEYFKDEFLDKLEAPAIGIVVVPLAQVRKELAEAVRLEDEETARLANEDSEKVDAAVQEERRRQERKRVGDSARFWLESDVARSRLKDGHGRTHPLVPWLAKLPAGDGLIVASVTTSGPGDKAGLRLGDIIFTVRSKKMTNVDDLRSILADPKLQSQLGDEPLLQLRNGLVLKMSIGRYEEKRDKLLLKRSIVDVPVDSERNVLLAPLAMVPDPIKGNAYYSHHNILSSTHPNIMSLAFLRATSEKPNILALSLTYEGKEWVFVNQVTIRVDGKNFEFPIPSRDMISKVQDNGSVYEMATIPIHGKEKVEMLNAVVSAEKVLVRFSGRKGRHDVDVPAEARLKIQEVYKVYQKLGGE